jgi:hypothetical protein
LNSSSLIAQIESKLASNSSGLHRLDNKSPELLIPSGIQQVDDLAGGVLRGAITALTGPLSSGKTTIMLSALATASGHGEVCAVVDTGDMFDVASATEAGVDLGRLLWVRCGNKVNTALKAGEMILQSGGFGLVILDFGDDLAGGSNSLRSAIPDSAWYRFRRAIENTFTALLVVGPESLSVSCAATILDLKPSKARWGGAGYEAGIASPLLGLEVTLQKRKPVETGTPMVFSASLAQEISDC